MSVNIIFPSPDNYQEWQTWAKAVVRGLETIFTSTQVIQDAAAIVSFPSAVTPPGWLKCNGAAFDKQGYPFLASIFSTGNLPNLTSSYGVGYTVWIKAA